MDQIRKMTFKERLALYVMSKLRWNEKGEFYQCHHNDRIMKIACILLNGRDPVDFLKTRI